MSDRLSNGSRKLPKAYGAWSFQNTPNCECASARLGAGRCWKPWDMEPSVSRFTKTYMGTGAAIFSWQHAGLRVTVGAVFKLHGNGEWIIIATVF